MLFVSTANYVLPIIISHPLQFYIFLSFDSIQISTFYCIVVLFFTIVIQAQVL